jgi:hypothetical protein
VRGRAVGIKRRLLSSLINWLGYNQKEPSICFRFCFVYYFIVICIADGVFGAVSSKEVTWLLGFAKLGCMDAWMVFVQSVVFQGCWL